MQSFCAAVGITKCLRSLESRYNRIPIVIVYPDIVIRIVTVLTGIILVLNPLKGMDSIRGLKIQMLFSFSLVLG